uniref:Secreted protein n=1 Tax=Prorocentrum micans TaxID=2945 RepID=A0A7S2X680_PROMC|mmetsp:Transcript_2259/g.1804  ORF Transcript_2259/g.1804 Transcript_2259/m.1804 type:complete len:161 (+) Transcript_2259:47-529(+)
MFFFFFFFFWEAHNTLAPACVTRLKNIYGCVGGPTLQSLLPRTEETVAVGYHGHGEEERDDHNVQLRVEIDRRRRWGRSWRRPPKEMHLHRHSSLRGAKTRGRAGGTGERQHHGAKAHSRGRRKGAHQQDGDGAGHRASGLWQQARKCPDVEIDAFSQIA